MEMYRAKIYMLPAHVGCRFNDVAATMRCICHEPGDFCLREVCLESSHREPSEQSAADNTIVGKGVRVHIGQFLNWTTDNL